MAIAFDQDRVYALKAQYQEEKIWYAKSVLNLHAERNVSTDGFVGSANTVFMTAKDSIFLDMPGCIAAPFVNIVAKKVINLGMKLREDESMPVRLYAPKQLSITAKELKIGNIQIMVEPGVAFVTCKKLTLLQSTDEEPDYFEQIKGWVINDDVEIETIQQSINSD